MDIAERLNQNEKQAKQLQASLQQLEQDKQNLLMELLRLDGEHRLLLELAGEVKKDVGAT